MDTQVPSSRPVSPLEGASTPPPLPTPGTGGREELPQESTRTQETRPAGCGSGRVKHRFGGHGGHDLASSRSRVIGAAAFIGMLVAVWALSGGGHFWPGWVMIGWGLCLVPDVTRLVEGRDGRGSAAR